MSAVRFLASREASSLLAVSWEIFVLLSLAEEGSLVCAGLVVRGSGVLVPITTPSLLVRLPKIPISVSSCWISSLESDGGFVSLYQCLFMIALTSLMWLLRVIVFSVFISNRSACSIRPRLILHLSCNPII